MARKSKGRAREKRRLGHVAINLMLVGAGLVLAPFLLSFTGVGKALSGLLPTGLVLLAIGAGLMVWMSRRPDPDNGASRSEKPLLAASRPLERSASPAPLGVRIRPQAWGTPVFEAIEWRRFEAVVERLFQQAGFDTRSQSHGADDGVDVWLYSRSLPGEPVSLVQCKHWQGRRVGVDKIRELRGVMAARNVKRGQFVATGGFTARGDHVCPRERHQPAGRGRPAGPDRPTHA